MTKYTDAQRAAIETRGAPMLVSAGAGSGKTSVLVERLMRYISEGDNAPGIESFLVITYTRAAAAELRARIAKRLGELIAENPTSRRLRRQAALLPRARIETIHKFCGEVLRAGGSASPLGAGYSVIDDARAGTIKKRVFDRVIEDFYSNMAAIPGFRELVDTVGSGRDDASLEDIVYNLHTKIISHPYPAEWLEKITRGAKAPPPADMGDTPLGREVLEGASALAEYWERRLMALYGDIEASPEGEIVLKNYGEQLLTTCASLRDFIRAAASSWDRASEFHEIRFDTLGRKKVAGDGVLLREYAKSVIDLCKKQIKAELGVFRSRSGALIREEGAANLALGALGDLALRFEDELRRELRRLGLAEFTDLEHGALELLIDRETGAATELARRFSESFTEVMVDEYQDVSRVQDFIMRAVSSDGQKLFSVGDVKQSIYRFRLAEPGLFLEKYASFAPYDGAAPGEAQKIIMNENFRSRDCVIDAVNGAFGRLMSPRLGEMEYGPDEALIRRADYPADGENRTELALIDVPALLPGESSSFKKDEAEAEYAAARILELAGEGTSYSDVAILMRSPSRALSVFRRVLAARGIPVRDAGEGEFLTSDEITAAISLLRVINNPRDDVGLVSVLRSPVFAFTPDEMAFIRASSPEADLYGALEAAAEKDAKCAEFLRLLEKLRGEAAWLPLPELVWRVFSETGMLAAYSALPGGRERRENLMRLFEMAADFESDGYRGLGAFTDELRAQAEKGGGRRSAAGGRGVTLMSVHKSKGLEFPVVFLCGTARKFNKTDLNRSVLCHPELGFGLVYTDFDRGARYPSLAHHTIRARLLRETLSEELRILYVAMTRARERLIMTFADRDVERDLELLRHAAETPPDAEELIGMSSPGKWLIAAALGKDTAIDIKMAQTATAARPEAMPEPRPLPTEEGTALEDIRARLEYTYPHARAVSLPSKLTATGALRELSPLDEDAAPLVEEEREHAFRLPEFSATRKRPTGADRGIATHLVMQHIDFARAGSEAEIDGEVARLSEAGFISREQAGLVDTRALLRFFRSELGARALAAEKIIREFRFSLLIRAGEIYEDGGDDEILMQGVIDLCLEEGGQLTVVDFKTDFVTDELLAEKTEHYAAQLRIYAAAMRRITGKPVAQAVICFLRTGDTAFIAL